jgi:elongation factor G
MTEVLNYSADITSMTSGKGVFKMKFYHYDDEPKHLEANIVKVNQKNFKRMDNDAG